MKTLHLTEVDIKEVIIIPNNSISILYKVSDDTGNIIFSNRLTIKKEDLPPGAQNTMDNFVQKLLDKVLLKEEL